jgi:hypothetical protein
VRVVRARCLLIAWAAPALMAVVASAASAQQVKPAAVVSRGRGPARAVAPAKKPGTSADAGASATPAGTLAAPVPTALPGGNASGDAGVSEYKTLDGGTRVFKFTELDIEGRLKSPQLVYFLRRVRAEFAAGDLGHRSFMREMSETRKESGF